jgi:hypothetical protein
VGEELLIISPTDSGTVSKLLKIVKPFFDGFFARLAMTSRFGDGCGFGLYLSLEVK